MQHIQTRAIILAQTPYNDKHGIVHLYTETHGRLGLLVPRKRTKQHLCLVPLSEVELTARLRPRRDLALLDEVHILSPNHRIQLEPTKRSQSIFLGELLYRLLTLPESDLSLYAFLSSSFRTLDALERGVANFYLCFTFRLLDHLAIAPHLVGGGHPSQWFDLREVDYTSMPREARLALSPREAQHLPVFARMTYDNLSAYRYTRLERGRIIDYLLLYCRLHLPPFPEIRSLTVLRASASSALATPSQGQSV